MIRRCLDRAPRRACPRSRTRSSTCTAARPTPRGARAWRSASRRRPAPRSRSCRRRPARCSRRSRPRRRNPKGDIWWAGPADSYLQAAEEGLLEEYRSPNVGAALRLGAADHRRCRRTAWPASTAASSRSATTPRSADKKKLPVPKCWKDLTNPALKGEVMLGNPNSSGTAYLMLASLVQVMGEDEAFRYMVDAQPQRDELRALRHRPDDGGDARRGVRSAARCCTA